MSIFKETKCLFYTNEKNNIKTNEYKCTVVCQSGTTSLGIYDMGLQVLIKEKDLRESLLESKNIKTDCNYINFNNKNIEPIKCKVKLDVTKSKIRFQILNVNNYFEINNEHLKKILDIREKEE